MQLQAQMTPCSAFVGLPSVCCASDSSFLLTPTNHGGLFSGSGIVGNTFYPGLAGSGTHKITYSLTPNYLASAIPWVNNLPMPVNAISSINDHVQTNPIPIGFTFRFFGIAYDYFSIHSDGYITFDSTNKDTNNAIYALGPNASPRNLIAGVWTKIYNPGPGNIAYQVYGNAPNRYLLVTWNAKRYTPASTQADVSFSILLRESSNIIETYIKSANETHATSGLENADETQVIFPPFNFDFNHFLVNAASPKAFRYTPSATCTESSSQWIKVRPKPTLSISANADFVCTGGVTQLYAQGASSYLWQPGNIQGDTILISPNVPTVYTCVGTDSNQCFSEDSFGVTTGTNLFFPVTSSKQYLCKGDSAVIKAKPGYQYVWQPGNRTGDSIVVSPTVTTTYTITGNTNNMCSGTVLYTVYVLDVNNTIITPNHATCPDSLMVSITGNGILPGKRVMIADQLYETSCSQIMNSLFLSDWQRVTSSDNMETVFDDSTRFVLFYLADNVNLDMFFKQHQQRIEHWVARGGRLLLTYPYYYAPAPHEDIALGFGNTKIKGGYFVESTFTMNPAHAIYDRVMSLNLHYGWVNNCWEGDGLKALVQSGSATTPNFGILSGEKAWGNGLVYFHGLFPQYSDSLLFEIVKYVSQTPLHQVNYTWNNQSHLPYQSPLNPNSNYSVLIQAGNCQATASYSTIGIKPAKPEITLLNDSICVGGIISLQTTSNDNVFWQPGNASTKTIQVSPTLSTIYTVTATNANACTQSNTAIVHVKKQIKGVILPEYTDCKMTKIKANVYVDNPRTKHILIENEAIGTNDKFTPQGYNEDYFQRQFGLTYYQKLKYNQINVDSVFSSKTHFVCMEGSYLSNKAAFWDFYNTHKHKIEQWVYEGGRLLIHCTSNYAEIGFGNTVVSTSNHDGATTTGYIKSSLVNYPMNSEDLFTFDMGNLSYLYGEGWRPLIYRAPEMYCAEKTWGLGHVVINGGLSNYSFGAYPNLKVIFYNLNYYAAGLDEYRGNFPFSFLWSTQEQTQTISPTQNGLYSVTMTSIPGYYCTDTASIWVNDSVSFIDTFSIYTTGPIDSLSGRYRYIANIPLAYPAYTLQWFNNEQLIFEAEAPINDFVYTPSARGDIISAKLFLPCNQPSAIQSNLLPGLGHGPAPITIFPNPTHDLLFISGLLQDDEVRLLDIQGNTLHKVKIKDEGVYHFSMKSFSNAVYMVQVIQSKRIVSTRILKE